MQLLLLFFSTELVESSQNQSTETILRGFDLANPALVKNTQNHLSAASLYLDKSVHGSIRQSRNILMILRMEIEDRFDVALKKSNEL